MRRIGHRRHISPGSFCRLADLVRLDVNKNGRPSIPAGGLASSLPHGTALANHPAMTNASVQPPGPSQLLANSPAASTRDAPSAQSAAAVQVAGESPSASFGSWLSQLRATTPTAPVDPPAGTALPTPDDGSVAAGQTLPPLSVRGGNASFHPPGPQLLAIAPAASPHDASAAHNTASVQAAGEPPSASFVGWLSQLQATTPPAPVNPPIGTVVPAPGNNAVASQTLLPISGKRPRGKAALSDAKARPKSMDSMRGDPGKNCFPHSIAQAPQSSEVANATAIPTPATIVLAVPAPTAKESPNTNPLPGIGGSEPRTDEIETDLGQPAARAASIMSAMPPAETTLAELDASSPAITKGASAGASIAAPTAGSALPFSPLPETAHARAPSSPAATTGPLASQQVAPALVQLSHTAGGGQLTLRLNPGELGHVQVQIDRTADGAASVHITVERPETLQLLVSDQAQLHRALDMAGVPQDGRTLSLTLGNPDPSNASSFGAAGDGSGGRSSTDARSGGQHDRPASGWGTGTNPATTDPALSLTGAIPAPDWLRAGVDITA